VVIIIIILQSYPANLQPLFYQRH